MNRDEGFLHTTMRITGVSYDDEKFVGTSFLFYYYDETKNRHDFLVSNAHVFDPDSKELKAIALRETEDNQPDYGNPIEIDLRCRCGEIHVTRHPDPEVDVAVINAINLIPNDTYRAALHSGVVLSEQPLSQGLKEGAFESVLFIGYPTGLYDEANFLPLARFGKTATLLKHDYNGRPCFLIDASVFGGSSGSPVFVYKEYIRNVEGGVAMGQETYFAGILAAAYVDSTEERILPIKTKIERKKGTLTNRNNEDEEDAYEWEIDLGLVFKSSTILETIELALKEDKARRDEQAPVRIITGKQQKP